MRRKRNLSVAAMLKDKRLPQVPTKIGTESEPPPTPTFSPIRQQGKLKPRGQLLLLAASAPV